MILGITMAGMTLSILRVPVATIRNQVMKMFDFIGIISLKANSFKMNHRMEEDLTRYVT